MRVEVDGPAVAGGRVRARVVEAGADTGELEVRLESFESSGQMPSTQVHDRRTATPGETVELCVPDDARPGWTAGKVSVGWQISAKSRGLLGTTVRAELGIDPASTLPMTDDRARQLQQAADAAGRRAARSELPTLALFLLMWLAIIVFGLYLVASPPEGSTWVVGACIASMGVLFCAGFVVRYLRRVESLDIKNCTIRPGLWATRGGAIDVEVETGAPIDVAVLCRIDRVVRSDSYYGPRGATFVESTLGEQRRQVEPGQHRLEFRIPSNLPPTHAGELIRVRHVVQATRNGGGENNHRRTEVSFVVA